MAQNAKPIIAYQNKLEDGTLTASTEASGYSRENLADWRTYTRWKGVSDKDDDISQTEEASWRQLGITSTHKKLGQVFTISVSSKIAKATFKLRIGDGSPTDKVKCALYDTTGSPPVPNNLLATSPTEVSPTSTPTDFDFEFDYNAAPGVYALVLYRTGELDDANYYQARYKDSNVYADGTMVILGTSSWAAYTAYDLYFKVQYAYLDQWIKLDAGSGNTFAVNCLAICGHDLNAQGVTNLALKYSDDGQNWSNCFDPFNPSDDRTIFKTFTEKTYRYFRLVIPSGYTAPPQIGVLFIGSYFSFPVHADPGFDPDEQEKEFEGRWSREGHLLGAISKYTRREISVRFQRLSTSFISNTLLPFWRDHVPCPFFWAWDITNHGDEVYLVSLSKGGLSMPYTANTRSLELEMAGVKE